jgi:hypothetical protein
MDEKRAKLDDEWLKREEEMRGCRLFCFEDDPPLSFTVEEEETMERNFRKYCQEFGDV